MLHALPRIALEPTAGMESCGASETCRSGKSPIEPPWAVLPWNEPAKAPAQVKVVEFRTDIISKGSLIDLFI